MSNVSSFGVPEFTDLKTSTKTVMVYTNILFNIKDIFRTLPITPIDIPLTKKKHKVDKKRITAPYGAIYSISTKKEFRGVDLKAKRDPKTVIEPKSIDYFLNQLTIVMSIGKINLNIMMFKDSLKIVGCKDTDDAGEAMMILWENYIRKSRVPLYTLKPNETDVRFLFKVVMRNVDFKLGFFVDRQTLNTLMNSTKYKEEILMSQYETTEHTNVNIKMFSKKPKGFLYDCLIYNINPKKPPHFVKYSNNPYKNPKKKKKPNYITFIVFSSSEIILSGRYDSMMKKRYEFFVNEMFKNRKIIEENILEKSKQKAT